MATTGVHALGWLLALAAAPAMAERISIRADEWLPYNGSSAMRPAGYMIEMAQQIAKAAGHDIDYRHLPWDDALEGVRKGDFDCLVGASAEEAEGYVLPKAAWGVSQSAAYTLNDLHTGIGSLEDILALRFAVIPDYSYGEEMDAWLEANPDSDRIVRIDTGANATLAALSWLVTRKVDVVIEDRNVMLNALQQAGLGKRVVERLPVGAADPIYIACTPANPRGAQFAQLFDEGTRSLRESGQLQQILQRYGLQDWLSLEQEAGAP